jgi:hypothetical protein
VKKPSKPALLRWQWTAPLFLLCIAAVAAAIVSGSRGRGDLERQAVAALKKVGCGITFSEPQAQWLRPLVGDRITNELFPQRPILLRSNPARDGLLTNAELEHLRVLSTLEEVYLSFTGVDDEGLTNLSELRNLRVLTLAMTDVTDAGLPHLAVLQSLEMLDLGGTRVTDVGLEHLESLSNLEELWLAGTKVTDAGVTELQRALPTARILWDKSTAEQDHLPELANSP